MKTKLAVLLGSLLVSSFALRAQTTAFTYQGRLQHGGAPANDLYEMSFALHDATTNGNVVGTPITIAPVPVSNGLFTVTLDFGAAAFMGADRWLEIAVTVFGSDQPVVTLVPRQPLTPTPYALHAHNAAGLMSFANAPLDIKVNGQRALRLEYSPVAPNLIGGFEGNVVSEGVAGATVAGGGRLDDDAGTALHHEITADQATIGGGAGNRVHGYAATIAGGYQNVIEALAHRSTIGGGFRNRIETNTDVSTIAGGTQNRIGANAPASTIAGGGGNIIESGAETSFIGGGQINLILSGSVSATIGGGVDNIAGTYAVVGGGQNNRSTGPNATVGGGVGNRSLARTATIGGGHWNQIQAGAEQAQIGGGHFNWIDSDSFHSTISGGASNFMASKVERSTIGGGANNTIGYFANATTIGGGMNNTIDGVTGGSTISGGWNNHINEEASLVTIAGGGANLVSDNAGSSVISGGEYNQVYASFGTISGGQGNRVATLDAHYAAIGGGLNNETWTRGSVIGGGEANRIEHDRSGAGGPMTHAEYSTISGGRENLVSTGAEFAAIAGGHQNQVGTNAMSAAIGGGVSNQVKAAYAVISGGLNNRITENDITVGVPPGDHSVIGGGRDNVIQGNVSVIAGGHFNFIEIGDDESAGVCVIGGGGGNRTWGDLLTIAGGGANRAAVLGATVSGGAENVASNYFAVVSGGRFNKGIGDYSVVPGGTRNEARKASSFAAGFHARALHIGAFVWADASGYDPLQTYSFDSETTNEFAARATGGVRFVTAIDGTGSNIAGVTLAPGSGTWSSLSDRNAKENFTAANAREILDKVAALPLASWNYKAQDKSVRHLGPMAQDFHAAFGLGENHRTITTVDADGVALAAIQGLNQKVNDLSRENAELRTRLTALEQLITNLNPKGN